MSEIKNQGYLYMNGTYEGETYEQQYKESQGAVRAYAHSLRKTQKKLDLAVDIILALRKEVTLVPTKIQKQIDALVKGGYRG